MSQGTTVGSVLFKTTDRNLQTGVKCFCSFQKADISPNIQVGLSAGLRANPPPEWPFPAESVREHSALGGVHPRLGRPAPLERQAPRGYGACHLTGGE